MRTALVGGGAGGIGGAAAAALLAAGHRVVLAGRHADTLKAAANHLASDFPDRIDYLVCDLADGVGGQAAVGIVEARHGALDIVVVNAGGPPPGRVLTIDDQTWRASFDLLLLGPLALARRALPAMAARGFGRLVVVTSTAVRQPQPQLATSTVLRAAVTAAAKLLSLEYAASGVTVNCVAPGATDTPRRSEILRSRAAAAGTDPALELAADTDVIPAGRVAQPAEIGSVIAFLASEAASYVNGTVLAVDGGRTETV